MNPRRIAKFLTALAGAAAQILTLGLVEGDTREWITVTISVLTATAVYLVPNEPGATPAPGTTSGTTRP